MRPRDIMAENIYRTRQGFEYRVDKLLPNFRVEYTVVKGDRVGVVGETDLLDFCQRVVSVRRPVSVIERQA